MEFVMYLVYILIFPGLLFSTVFGLWLAGIDRKVVARMQKRVGPPVLQPTYDFFKLLGKETIVPSSAARHTFLIAPYVGLVSLVVTALFIPIGGMQAFSGMADMVVILYLITIPSLAMIFGGSASASPFAGVGISRSMVAIIAYELPLILVLLAVGKAAGGGAVTFSLEQVTLYQQLFGSFLFDWRLIPAAAAMLLVIPCEVGRASLRRRRGGDGDLRGPAGGIHRRATGGVQTLPRHQDVHHDRALHRPVSWGGISTGHALAGTWSSPSPSARRVTLVIA